MAKPETLAMVMSSIRQALTTPVLKDQCVIVNGHVQGFRNHRNVVFIDLTDGSTNKPLQCIMPKEHKDKVSTGSYLSCLGTMTPSQGSKQAVELKIKKVRYNGPCEAKEYPFSAFKELYPFHYYRKWLHLRPRDDFFKSLARVRSELLLSTHMIMKQMDFFQVDTPILTSNDSESNSDLFVAKRTKSFKLSPSSPDDIEFKSESSNEDDCQRQIRDDYFRNEIFLTCSAQLHLEIMASSLSKVYTISHTFRAENSVTRRHLCEFPMLEAEEAHATSLETLMNRVESILKFMTNYIVNISEHNIDTHKLIKQLDNSSIVNRALNKPFVRMEYAEAIKNLHQKNVDVVYGQDIARNHEKILLEYCDNVPLFITNYPQHLKPFYMKINQTKKEAECFDLIAPIGGEICGGSLREDSYDALLKRIRELEQVDGNLEKKLSWYLDLRKFGTFPHGGFGVGMDRFVQSLIGIKNIKDVNMFPRWSGNCQL